MSKDLLFNPKQRCLITKKSNSITLLDYLKPSNRDYPVTSCKLLPITYS